MPAPFQTTPTPPSPAEAAVLDHGKLQLLDCLIGADKVDDLVRMFLSDTAELLAQAREAAVVEDAAALRRHFHALKSTSGELGAARLHRLCVAVEHEDAASAWRTHVDDAHALFGQVRAQLLKRLGAA